MYCLDTTVLIESWVRLYPPDIFPSFWDRLDELIRDGTALAPQEVLEEISRQQDELLQWVKSRQQMFIEVDDAQQARTTEIVDAFSGWVVSGRTRNLADPFVVALAIVRGLTVVTEEKPRKNKPNIPNVCDHFSVECIDVVGLIRAQSWQF